MNKFQKDLTITDIRRISEQVFLLTLADTDPLPDIIAGQFLELLVEGAHQCMLRRPFSIHNVNRSENTLELLIQIVGNGTARLATLSPGEKVNVLFPLGNGYTYRNGGFRRPLLVGGGVGTAPVYLLGKELKVMGIEPTFLLGGRSAVHILRKGLFEQTGELFVTTQDGTMGLKGMVTDHISLREGGYDMIFACGPTPMLKAVAASAEKLGVECEVSLEHKMACGIGACLCCVEDTVDGNLCVCKEGPVFNTKRLKWQI